MTLATVVDLMLKYRAIRLFIRECYIKHEDDKLFDFLMDIETEDPSARNIH